MDNFDFDTRPIRPDHDSRIDRSALLSGTKSNDTASKLVERAGLAAIAIMLIAALIVNLVR